MKIRIYEELARKLGQLALRKFNDSVDFQTFSWQRYIEVNLLSLDREQVVELLELIKPYATKGSTWHGAQTLRDDVRSWLKAFDDPGAIKARTCQHFCALVTELLAGVPGHRVYWRDPASAVWYAYFISEIKYHPKQHSSRREEPIPEHTDITLVWLEFGGTRTETITFWINDCGGQSARDALLRAGYAVETPELRERYLADAAAFNETVPLIGQQFLARGSASDDCDGNRDGDRWSRYSKNLITLDRDGEPARVVVDLFYEKDEKDDKEKHYERWFWRRHEVRLARRKAQPKAKAAGAKQRDEDDEPDDEELADVYDKEPVIEVPLHPMLAVFDLRRQLRLRVHLGQLTRYQYDPSLGEKLILPVEERRLVEMLLEHKGVFRDVIVGKGQGAIILCEGPPGTGKTLTAEIFSEVSQRPLYSVQCSQLGLSAEDLEQELLKTFARAQRWNAILLLDEADVYINERGTDMAQNAIVGVFLRVLEYYKGVLFLTTNRGDAVDDAIASRCVARVHYPIPSAADQKRIWRIIADAAGIKVTQADIEAIVKQHDQLTGRDIKNLLKLIQLTREDGDKRSMPERVTFVKRFKPTRAST